MKNLRLIVETARGRWPEILAVAGIDESHLTNKHGPCPICGGKDRFRFDDLEGRGTFICTHCGAGDGLKLLELQLKTDFKGAAGFAEKYLGIEPGDGVKLTRRYIGTAEKAIAAWTELQPAPPSHAYLKRKGIKPHIARVNGNELIIPIQSDLDGTMEGVQRILPAKNIAGDDKFYVKGTKKRGNFCPLGKIEPDKPVYFCEGFATGASIHEAIGYAVVVCFDAGNFWPVVKKLRAELKQAQFLICADSAPPDTVEKARKAAQKFAGYLAVPDFTGYEAGTDFNDLATTAGLEEVTRQLSDEKNWESFTNPSSKKTPKQNAKSQFTIENERLIYYLENPGEAPVPITVCGHIEVIATTLDRHNRNEGRLLKFKTRRGQWREHLVKMEALAGDGKELAGTLSSLGFWIHHPYKSVTRQRLAEYVNDSEPAEIWITIEQSGWYEQSFVLPGADTIGPDKVIYNGPDSEVFQASGKLSEWQREIAARCVGNSRLLFAVALAFCGPLMRHTRDSGLGVNLYGESSSGKSTTMLVAASGWGSPDIGGVVVKWNSTLPALELQAVTRNDTLYCLDEVGEVDPKVAAKAAYGLASGVEKGRGRVNNGAVDLAGRRTWLCPVLSNGEKPFADQIEESGQRQYGGQAVRMMDIPADADKGFGVFEDLHGLLEAHEGNAQAAGAAFAELLRDKALSFHGTAGPAFVAGLLKMGLPAALDFVNETRNQFVAEHVPANASGLVRRGSKLFSLTAAAGELAIKQGILPWAEGTASQAAATCFQDWMAENGVGNPEERKALAQVAAFIEANMQNFRGLEEPEAGKDGGRSIPNQKGYTSEDREIFYLYKTIFEQETCKQYGVKRVVKLLKARDALLCNHGNQYELKRPGCRRAYAIVLEKLHGDDGEMGKAKPEVSNTNVSTIPQSLPNASPLAENSTNGFSPMGNADGDNSPMSEGLQDKDFPSIPKIPTPQGQRVKTLPELRISLEKRGFQSTEEALRAGAITEYEARLLDWRPGDGEVRP